MATPSPLLSVQQLQACTRLGQQLARLRVARKIKQADAALRAGLSRNTVYRLEKGDPGVAIGQVLRYLEAIADDLTDEQLESRLYRPWLTSFCVKYRKFAKAQQRSMRQLHIVGERLFVDHSGDSVPVINASTGEITWAQIFVAVRWASNYTFACAPRRQAVDDVLAHSEWSLPQAVRHLKRTMRLTKAEMAMLSGMSYRQHRTRAQRRHGADLEPHLRPARAEAGDDAGRGQRALKPVGS